MLLNQQERPPRKYLLSVIRNRMLIEINLSQIRISDSNREKVHAVCPYLLFLVVESCVRVQDNPLSLYIGQRNLFVWFVYVAMLLNQQERSPRKYCYQSSVMYCLQK